MDRKHIDAIAANLGGKSSPAESEPEAPEMDGDEAEKDAGEAMIEAIEQKDPMAIVKAFKSLFEMCDSTEDESESGDEGEAPEEE